MLPSGVLAEEHKSCFKKLFIVYKIFRVEYMGETSHIESLTQLLVQRFHRNKVYKFL